MGRPSNFSLLSESEKVEMYSIVAEMVRDGLSVSKISLELDINKNDVKRIAKELKLEFAPYAPSKIRAVTKKERALIERLYDDRKAVSKIAKIVDMNQTFLKEYIEYLQLPLRCKECCVILNTVNDEKNTKYYCGPCRKKRINQTRVAVLLRQYHRDKEFREKWIKRVRDAQKLKAKNKLINTEDNEKKT